MEQISKKVSLSRFRYIRVQAGYPQRVIAQVMGISRSTLSSYETGRILCSENTVLSYVESIAQLERFNHRFLTPEQRAEYEIDEDFDPRHPAFGRLR